jgi:hypothetical protein
MGLRAVEHLASNTLASQVCESMKNKKQNDKCNETQKLVTEMYIQVNNLRIKAEEEKKTQVEHRLSMSQYLHSMRKMDRIIKDISQGKLEYLQYLDFYKSVDSSLIRSMNVHVSTSHKFPGGGDKKKMFDAPFKSYQRFKWNKMQVIVTGRSRLPVNTEMAITSDEKGEDVIQYVQMDDNKHEDVKFPLNRSDFYIHYPVKRPTLVAFGSQDRARLGTGRTSQDVSYTNLQLPSKVVPKEISARRHFTCILDSQNQIYISGNVRGMKELKEFTLVNIPNEAQLQTYAVGRHSVVVLGTDQRLYWWGKSKYKHFQENDGQQGNFTLMPTEAAPRLLEGKIIQMASGSHCTLFVTNCGQLFARGKVYLENMQLPVIPTAMLVPLDERYVAKKAYCTTGSRNQ